METAPGAALLLFYFLEEGSWDNQDLQKELASLQARLVPSSEDDDVQPDGLVYYHPPQYLDGLLPQAVPQWRDELVDEEAVRNVAAGLIEIADQLESMVTSQATMNLIKKLETCHKEGWTSCLCHEVQQMRRGGLSPSLDQLPEERLLLVLTFTLVKGVCKRAPRLLHGLFDTALQCVSNLV